MFCLCGANFCVVFGFRFLLPHRVWYIKLKRRISAIVWYTTHCNLTSFYRKNRKTTQKFSFQNHLFTSTAHSLVFVSINLKAFISLVVSVHNLQPGYSPNIYQYLLSVRILGCFFGCKGKGFVLYELN
jgi:hypothetical protein